MQRDSDGVHVADSIVWAMSLVVIAWALWAFFSPATPATDSPLTLSDCLRQGHVETPAGPVFCVLVAERRAEQ